MMMMVSDRIARLSMLADKVYLSGKRKRTRAARVLMSSMSEFAATIITFDVTPRAEQFRLKLFHIPIMFGLHTKNLIGSTLVTYTTNTGKISRAKI